MIRRSTFCLQLTSTELKALVAIKPWKGKDWDSPPNAVIEAIKARIRAQLVAVQTHCAYCGLELGGTSGGEIEHIAPKAFYRHPQFTFSLWNLVMACDYCNGFSKKSTKDTIVAPVQACYKKCQFNIVHPYFDDPDDHYEWTDIGDQILIQIKDGSTKATNAIGIFGLAEPKMSEFRAKQKRFEEYKVQMALSAADEATVNLIMNT